MVPFEMSLIRSLDIATRKEYLPKYSITFSAEPFGGSI